MRLVAYFMRRYPAYTYDEVMKMEDWLFNDLVEQAQRIDAQDAMILMTATAFPHLKQKESEKIIASYELRAKDPEDDVVEFDEEKLKKMFGTNQ